MLPFQDRAMRATSSALMFAAVSIFALPTYSDDSTVKLQNPFSEPVFKVSEEVTGVDADYRKNWTRLSGFELSGLHWNQFVVVYTNIGKKAYRNNFYEYFKAQQAFEDDEDYQANYQNYPVGSVMVKENFSVKEGKPDSATTLTTMIKREKGFSSAFNDWEFIETDIKGNVLLKGQGEDKLVYERCVSCHVNMAERDYIFSTFLSENAAKD